MSFEIRMEQLDLQLTDLESSAPFILTQDFAPNQKNWEAAWLAAGNTLPIPTYQELYWQDDFALRGEYKTLPDQFSLLARSKAEGFEIRDIAGWSGYSSDGSSLIVFVIRDDITTGPDGCCRLYMDGTLEEILFVGFAPTGLLGYDPFGGELWYYEGLVIKRISLFTATITTVATAVSGGLPEWRFFVTANIDTASIRGDVMFGARIGADPARALYYYDRSALTLTKVMTTFNPGTGAVIPDRPLAFTQNYVFLSELDARSGFDGNKIHQITRSGFTWQIEVDNGVSGSTAVRTIIGKTNYVNNTVDVVIGHLLPEFLSTDWNQTIRWDGDTQTGISITGQPHQQMLQTLRQNVNDHNLAYHIDTRVYYDPTFIADGGSEEHYNNIGGILWNYREDCFLIHDLGWHIWTKADAPDLYIYAAPEEKRYDVYLHPEDYPIGSYPLLYPPDPFFPIDFTIDSYTPSTRKIYRINDWSQYDEDIIVLYKDTFQHPLEPTISLVNLPADYGMIEIIQEVPAGDVSNVILFLNSPVGGGLHSSNTQVLAHADGNSLLPLAGNVTTNAHIRHYFIPRYKLGSGYEIHNLVRHSVKTSDAHVHVFSEGMFLKTSETEVLSITLPASGSNNPIPYRVVVRAWRTIPRVKPNGDDYDPSMA